MHDVIAHSLAVIVSQAQGGQYAARTDPERAIAVLATIAEAGRQTLADMRGLVGVLRTDDALNGEEGWAPQPTLRDLPVLLDRVRGAGLPVQYSESGPARPLGPAAELALYRVVQEALTNTLKHAGRDARADVRFMWTDDGLTLTVSDNGHSSTPSNGGGHGLIGMRERLAAVGGSVVAGSGPGGGFVVRAQMPCHAASRGRGDGDDPGLPR
ncbi:MAG: sensor histidine kinase [Thermomicrobiales bacterium]